MKASLRLRQIWGMPVALGFATAIGLVAALVSDDIGDPVSWGALALPIVMVIWHGKGSPQSRQLHRSHQNAGRKGI